jgi:hypothetical protein
MDYSLFHSHVSFVPLGSFKSTLPSSVRNASIAEAMRSSDYCKEA